MGKRSQLIQLAIIDASDLSLTQEFTVVQEGSGEASRQAISIEPSDTGQLITGDSQIKHTSNVYDLMITVLDDSPSVAQLNEWADDRTELIFVGYGLGGQILQMEGILNVVTEYDSHVTLRFNSQREATGGYTASGKHSAGLSYDENGLSLFKWDEGSTANIPAGWTASGGSANWDDANSEFDFSTTAVSGQSLSRDIHFPFAKQITFSVDFTSITVSTGVSLEMEEYDESGSLVDSTTESVVTSGRESVAKALDETTAYVTIKVNIGQNDDISIKNPVLGLDGNTTFTEFNT